MALLPALPSISAAAIWPTAAASGAVAVAAQLGLLAKFKSSKDPAVRSIAGLLAYRIIALAYTLVLTIVGGALWFNPARWPADAAAAMLVPDGTIRWIGAVLFGELILWDLPSTFWIKKLQKPDLIIHHVGLAIGPALVAMKFLPVFYYAWYIGLSESSSVLLALNEYFASLHTAIEDVEGEESPRLPAIASNATASRSRPPACLSRCASSDGATPSTCSSATRSPSCRSRRRLASAPSSSFSSSWPARFTACSSSGSQSWWRIHGRAGWEGAFRTMRRTSTVS